MSYSELKNKQPELFECFFAFSDKQFEEGIKKHNLEGKKIFRADGGLFGTNQGIEKLYADYEAINAEIKTTCQPQEVYDYEFINHECDYVGNDHEAIKIVASYFSDEQADTVKRRFGYVKISELDFSK